MPEIESVVQFLTTLIIFIFIIVICVLTTKFIGNFNKQQYSNKNVKVVETKRDTHNKFIQLLAIGEVYLVAAVCKDQISVLSQLTKEELPNLVLPEMSTTNSGVSLAFKESFGSILEKLKKK